MNREHGDGGDALLNAYLDEQIDAEERGRLLQDLRHDRKLAERVCALRQVKELTRHAYDGVGCDVGAPPARRPMGWGVAAALAFVLVGGTLGWWANDRVSGQVTQAHMVQLENVHPDALMNAAADARRVILHISSNQHQRLGAALDAVDRLLQAADREQNDLQVEVIVNSDGLDLLRADTSGYAARIGYLAENHRNVHFLACSKAVERLRRAGVEVNLLPEARIAEPALELILRRMRQGWLYVAA